MTQAVLIIDVKQCVEKSCSPYSSKWVGSHAVSNDHGYRQLRVSVNQLSSLHSQIVRKPASLVNPLQVKASKSFITPLVQQAQACNMKSDISPALSKSSNLRLLTIISSWLN